MGILICVAELFCMSLWFSASAVVPLIAVDWHLPPAEYSFLTLSVQLGFVLGTLLSSLLNLSDVIRPSRLIALSGAAAAAANALVAGCHDLDAAIPLRLLTGLFLAGVYPPAMKLIASWSRRSRGTALGALIGSLTLGKAVPYLVNASGIVTWQHRLLVTSAFAAAGAVLMLLFSREGPYFPATAPFDVRQFGQVFRNRGVRLASLGYFGHMWELYAMWTWSPVFLRASFGASHAKLAELMSFATIGAGSIGCVAAGLLADRRGKENIASGAMFLSGCCCLLIGFLFAGSPELCSMVMLAWGASVVADSAQFSACVTERANPQYVGTALTLQTCIGFLLTLVPIWLLPYAQQAFSWRYAFWILAPGPFLGIVSMLRLKQATSH